MHDRPFFFGEYEFRGCEFGSLAEPSLVEQGELGAYTEVAEHGPDAEKQAGFGSLLRTLFAYNSLHTLRLTVGLGTPGTTRRPAKRFRCCALFSPLHWFTKFYGENPIFEGPYDGFSNRDRKHKDNRCDYVAADHLADLFDTDHPAGANGMIAMGWGKPLSLHRFYGAQLQPLGPLPKGLR